MDGRVGKSIVDLNVSFIAARKGTGKSKNILIIWCSYNNQHVSRIITICVCGKYIINYYKRSVTYYYINIQRIREFNLGCLNFR